MKKKIDFQPFLSQGLARSLGRDPKPAVWTVKGQKGAYKRHVSQALMRKNSKAAKKMSKAEKKQAKADKKNSSTGFEQMGATFSYEEEVVAKVVG